MPGGCGIRGATHAYAPHSHTYAPHTPRIREEEAAAGERRAAEAEGGLVGGAAGVFVPTENSKGTKQEGKGARGGGHALRGRAGSCGNTSNTWNNTVGNTSCDSRGSVGVSVGVVGGGAGDGGEGGISRSARMFTTIGTVVQKSAFRSDVSRDVFEFTVYYSRYEGKGSIKALLRLVFFSRAMKAGFEKLLRLVWGAIKVSAAAGGVKAPWRRLEKAFRETFSNLFLKIRRLRLF